MEVPQDIPENRIKASIEDEIILICNAPGYAPYLRLLINSTRPGNPINTFEQFLTHFESLYLLSSDRKGLNKELIKKTKDFLRTKHKPNHINMTYGLDLFDEYKSELFRMNVI